MEDKLRTVYYIHPFGWQLTFTMCMYLPVNVLIVPPLAAEQREHSKPIIVGGSVFIHRLNTHRS